MKKNSTTKAKELLDKEQVYQTNDTSRLTNFIVKGSSGTIYNVIYNKLKEVWSCECKNIRLLDCYHIKACKKIKEINKNETKENTMF